MRLHAMAILAVLVSWFGLAGDARADTSVRVVETWPSGNEVLLGRNQNFYLRLAYTSDTPVKIWAQPYFHGKPANAGSNPSQAWPAGSGEAMGWFFFMNPGDEVDEIRISAGDGGARSTPVVASWRGHIAGGTAIAPAGEPDWVSRMNADAKAKQDEAYQKTMSQPVNASDVAWFNGFMLLMFALGLLGFAAPAWALWRWRGGWRIAAAIPAAGMAFVVLRIMIGTAIDPTSHNLWPFEILIAAALGVGAMLLLLLARKVVGVGSAGSGRVA